MSAIFILARMTFVQAIRRKIVLTGLVLGALTLPLVVLVADPSALLILVIVQGLILGLVPTTIFSAAVEVVGDERLGGLAMGVIMVGQNAGMLIGPIIFGALAESAPNHSAVWAVSRPRLTQ